MHSAGAGKMHRSSASLKMTAWIDAMDFPWTRRQKTPRKLRIAVRSLIFEHAGSRVGEGATQAMHYRGSSEGRAFC
jgi:hypothetical protein